MHHFLGFVKWPPALRQPNFHTFLYPRSTVKGIPIVCVALGYASLFGWIILRHDVFYSTSLFPAPPGTSSWLRFMTIAALVKNNPSLLPGSLLLLRQLVEWLFWQRIGMFLRSIAVSYGGCRCISRMSRRTRDSLMLRRPVAQIRWEAFFRSQNSWKLI